MKPTSLNPLINPLITIVALAGAIYLLVSQKVIFVPMALGLLFAFFALPVTRQLERKGVPRIVAILIIIILTIVLFAGLGVLLYFAISGFAQDIPARLPTIQAHITAFAETIGRSIGMPVETQRAWINENVNLVGIATRGFGGIATGVTSVIAATGLTVIYTFFLLYYRNKLMEFFRKLLGRHDEDIIERTVQKLADIVPSYLSGVIKVMIILAIVNTIGFWIIHVPNPIFFGILVAVLNVIPYAGPIIGFALVVVFSLITAGPGVAIAAIVMFLVIQFLENNILTPNISGGTININPFAAILGIIIGGVMWGVVGMVIALPFLGMVKVICDANPSWEAFGYLIGDSGTEEHALTWGKIKNIFSRKKK